MSIFQKIFDRIADREKNPKPESYVNRLLKEGISKTSKKVGEEASEVIIAALKETDERLVSEVADLWFHSLMLLYQRGVSYEKVFAELESRYGK
jgi:phosphoribosyl-ATP pyrophosphohydrolase